MKSYEIPAWCFLTGQFLIHFERNKHQKPCERVHRNFLNSITTEPQIEEFNYPNPGVIIMLCYGLLVYPLEFWKKVSKPTFQNIEDLIICEARNMNLTTARRVFDLFEKIEFPSSLDMDNFFRLLRNAVSHANVSFNIEQDKFTFWNIQRNGTKNFETTISRINLGIFLTGVGKFFINVQRDNR